MYGVLNFILLNFHRVTGPYPEPDTVIAYLLQTDLQAMMQEEGLTLPTSGVTASPAGGDQNAYNQSQERTISKSRTNYSSQSASEGRNATGSNARQSRLPPKRKDPERKLLYNEQHAFLTLNAGISLNSNRRFLLTCQHDNQKSLEGFRD